jgi:hypothetical protein
LSGLANKRGEPVADCSERPTPLTPTNSFEITKLTRVKMLLSIGQQHQAETAKSFVARQTTNDDRRAGAHAKTAKYKSTSMNSRKLQVAKGHEVWCD